MAYLDFVICLVFHLLWHFVNFQDISVLSIGKLENENNFLYFNIKKISSSTLHSYCTIIVHF